MKNSILLLIIAFPLASMFSQNTPYSTSKLLDLAKKSHDVGELATALQSLRKMHTICEEEDICAKEKLIEMHLLFSSVFTRQAEYDTSSSHIDQAKKIFSFLEKPDSSLYCDILYAQGILLIHQESYMVAQKHFEQMIALKNHDKKTHRSLLGLASVYHRTFRINQAIEYFHNGIHLMKSSHLNKHRLVEVQQELAKAYYKNRQAENAIESLQEALTLAESLYGINNIRLIPIYKDIVINQLALRKVQDILQSFKVCEKIIFLHHGTESIEAADFYSYQGIFYFQLRQYEKAIPLIQRALYLRAKITITSAPY